MTAISDKIYDVQRIITPDGGVGRLVRIHALSKSAPGISKFNDHKIYRNVNDL